MSNRFPITAIILTHNEAVNIADCLRSLDWVEDVVIVDSGSNDATLEIARATRPDIRLFSHPFLDFGDQRNWALDNTQPRRDWVLFVDADERITPSCAQAIRDAVERSGEYVGFFLTYRNLFMGRWIRHCTLYPSWQLRLLKRGCVRFQKEGHGQREIAEGPLGYIREPFDHYPFSKGMEEWIARHNVYSSNEAELIARLRREPLQIRDALSADPVLRRRALKRFAARLPCRPLFRFLYIYIWRRGFLDGYAGWVYTLLRMAHEIHITAKLAVSSPKQSQTPRSGATQGGPISDSR
jgi:glycosyltransferase involved in cell wall biosynthesis